MQKQIEIYGVPMDLGANLRGVDMGPSALRIAGIKEALEKLGCVVTDQDELNIVSRVNLPNDHSNAKYVRAIYDACLILFNHARDSKKRGSIPIFLGGDHSIAVGTVAGVGSFYQEKKQDIGLIWFDAHADMNTPDTSPSGNVHGMPLSALLGHGASEMLEIAMQAKIRPEKVFVIGARDLDEEERKIVARSGVTVFSMKEIDRLGMAEVTKRAIEGASADTAGIHLSFDIDGLDPEIAPGVGTPVRGGVTFREAHLFMELLADSNKLISMDVVELNPVKDIHNQTAEVVVHLVQSAFGRRIL